MNRRNLLNIGLLALVGLLLLLVLYEPGIEKPVAPPTLLSLDKGAITQITIRRDGQQEIELRLEEDGQWWMVQPLRHAADPFRIDSLLRIGTINSLGRFNVPPEKLAAYRLENPPVTLILNGETTIAFGDSTPLDQRRYVMVNGQGHLISDTLYYHLIGSFPTFLRRQLLDEGSGIDALTLPGLTIQWQEGRWHLEPEPAHYSADQVTRLLDGWRLASALEIKPYDGKGGEPITLTLRDTGHPLELLVTSRQPDLVLARPELGIQYHFDAATAAQLLQLPEPPQPDAEGAAPPDTDQHLH